MPPLQPFSRQQKLQKKESLDWSQLFSMPRTSPSSWQGAREHFLLTVVFLVGPGRKGSTLSYKTGNIL